MKPIEQLKKYLKVTAENIRKTRFQYKEAQRNGLYNVYCRLCWDLLRLQRDYRHHHIAYCELRGRTRDQIEQPRENNSPSEIRIQEIKKKYAWTPEEIEVYKERQEKRNARAA